MNNASEPCAVAARSPSILENLVNGLEGRNGRLQDVINRVEHAVHRLSGDGGSIDKQQPESPVPMRNGITGRFDSNLDQLDNLLNRLEGISSQLDEQV